MSKRSDTAFETIALIGLGLIGSSLARAIVAARGDGALSARVVAHDADPEVRDVAREIGLGDAVEDTLEAAVRGADLVIIATPVGAVEAVLTAAAPGLQAGAVVSDVGSVKGAVAQAFGRLLPKGVLGVPAHPVAGTEQSGPEAGFATLFEDRWCILTPGDGAAEAQAAERVAQLWRALGSKVEFMSAAHHDRVLAVTSHLPHLIAYTIVGTASDLEQVSEAEVVKYSAGGFRDFTRIAASDPTMWRDVFLNNREAVLELLGRFTEDLIALQRSIRWEEGDALFDHFSRTRAIRRDVIEQGQDTADPDFGRRSGPAGREES
ncbi:MAG: prephenate/arogenate dehydrogenase family protein [Pseudomonadota bacterium]